jgi:exodeoxyribonuclease V alpha subunit
MQIRKSNATDDEIINALKIRQAWGFVSERPNPLDYQIMAGGKNVSGGQMQRLTIARALIGEPEMLIFDDSSSALDFMTERIPNHFKLDPMKDVQVLTPMRRNLLGAESLNTLIQDRLNGSGPTVTRGAMKFRIGDRVMQLRNNYDKDVYNGDIGFIHDLNEQDRSLVVLFDGKPVEYQSGELDELTLSYATTIHKSQGSEYSAVIVLVHNQHYMMLQRNLLYTAITRGKKLVMVIGSPWAVSRAIETNTVKERRTNLANLLENKKCQIKEESTSPHCEA